MRVSNQAPVAKEKIVKMVFTGDPYTPVYPMVYYADGTNAILETSFILMTNLPSIRIPILFESPGREPVEGSIRLSHCGLSEQVRVVIDQPKCSRMTAYPPDQPFKLCLEGNHGY